MTPKQIELLHTLKNRQMPFEERYNAAEEIGREVSDGKITDSDIPQFYQLMVEFWRSLGLSKLDRENEQLFDIRTNLAYFCSRLSLKLPEGRKFFKYFPWVKRAEGFESRVLNKMISGILKSGYGKSIYDFHWEYPIEGFGIRKDLITVITEKNEKIPMLDWCRQNDIIVFCNRCGLDITFEVSRNCPFIKWRFSKRP